MKRKDLLGGPTQSTGVSMPANLLEAAKEKAQEIDRSFSWLVKQSLVEYLLTDGHGVEIMNVLAETTCTCSYGRSFKNKRDPQTHEKSCTYRMNMDALR